MTCPRCAESGIMAPLDGLTCAMNHGESSQSWANRHKVPALEDQPGFKTEPKPQPKQTNLSL